MTVVPVLADAPDSEKKGANGEARESTENCDRMGAAREICSTADSRGGSHEQDTDEA